MVLAATLLLARNLNFTMVPKTDESRLRVGVEMPAGSRVEDTNRQLMSLALQTGKIPGVAHVFSIAGGGAEQEVHKGELQVALVPLTARNFTQQQMQDYLRANLALEPGVIMTVSDMSALMGGGRAWHARRPIQHPELRLG